MRLSLGTKAEDSNGTNDTQLKARYKEARDPEPRNLALSFEIPSCKTLRLQIGVKETHLLGQKRQKKVSR